jgi:hypothetical protein
MEDARAGAFDGLINEALDRLSCDQEDVPALCKRLRFAGLTIIALTEGEITTSRAQGHDEHPLPEDLARRLVEVCAGGSTRATRPGSLLWL